MTDIRVSIGRPYEEMHEERRVATEQFVENLRTFGYDVELEIIERVAGRVGLTLVEWTMIYILAREVTRAIDKVTDDIYEAAKELLRSRRKAKKEKSGNPGRNLGFIIYGPDGKELRKWDTSDDDS
jgi:hypothetical protein